MDLSYGELDQDSALAVAQAMADKEHLKKIDLNGEYSGTPLKRHPERLCILAVSHFLI